MARLEFDDFPLVLSIISCVAGGADGEKWDPQNLANLVWTHRKSIAHVKSSAHALSAECIKVMLGFKPMELPITFWELGTVTLDGERALAKA